MRFSLYTAYHILFKMQERGKEKREGKEGKRRQADFQKSNRRGKEIKKGAKNDRFT